MEKISAAGTILKMQIRNEGEEANQTGGTLNSGLMQIGTPTPQ